MKRIISAILVCVLLMASVLSLASCGKISESYAEKINEAADAGEHYTYKQVKEDLGDNAIDLTVSLLGVASGVIIAAKGCESLDEIEDKLDAGKTVKGVVITILTNKAMSAAYREITEDDLH